MLIFPNVLGLGFGGVGFGFVLCLFFFSSGTKVASLFRESRRYLPPRPGLSCAGADGGFALLPSASSLGDKYLCTT